MRTWLIYIRKSVVRNDADMDSPERQLHVCKMRLELMESEPYQVEVYRDIDRSGSSETGRDGWQDLKAQLDRPDVVGVIASALDRLYRNVAEFLAFLNEIESRSLALVTAKESLNTSDPLGRFVVTILMAMAEMEWRLTSMRMSEMVNYKRLEQGRHWGGTPFGCERDGDGQLIPSQETYMVNGETRYYHDALADCFRLYASGQTYQTTADALNDAGHRFRDRKGEPSPWTPERVRGIVRRWRLYAGDLPLGNPLKGPVEWVEGGHDPILPVELCEAAASSSGDIRRIRAAAGGSDKRVYLLSGVLYCQCGDALQGQHYKRRLYRHRTAKRGCPQPNIEAEAIEAEVMGALVEIAHYPAMLNDVRRALRSLDDAGDGLASEIETVKRRLERLDDVYINDAAIEKPVYLERRQQLLNSLALLQSQQRSGDGDIVEDIVTWLGAIDQAEAATKKALIGEVIERLDVEGGRVSRLTPRPWAVPFFDSCQRWAGWESNPSGTTPLLVRWLQPAN